jgi:putative membrane protein
MWNRHIVIVFKGFLMGVADVVPGVSGGTIAFIVGIYHEWVESIKAVTSPSALRLLLSFRWREAASVLPWRFLLALVSGILLAIFTLARMMTWLLRYHPVLVWALFFGLVLASVWIIARQIPRWTATSVIGLLMSAVFAYGLVGLVPVETPHAWWFLILSGAIAICAMILPGISGAFILVLLGQYRNILQAVVDLDVATVFFVGFGCIVGISSFARVVSYLFRHHHDITMACLTGLMAGSLRKIWPWKETVLTTLNRKGETVPLYEANIIPAQWDIQVIMAIIVVLVGFALAAFLNRLGSAANRPQ